MPIRWQIKAMLSSRHDELVRRCVSGTVIIARDEERPSCGTWIVRVDRSRPRVVFHDVLDDAECDTLARSLRDVASVWDGQLKASYVLRPSIQLIWTLSPAPFRLYRRSHLLASACQDQLLVTRRFRRTCEIARGEIKSVESWMSPDGFFSGVSFVLSQSFKLRLVRVFNAHAIWGVVTFPYNQFGVEHIDEIWWAGRLGKRLAEHLDVPWQFYDPNFVYEESDQEKTI